MNCLYAYCLIYIASHAAHSLVLVQKKALFYVVHIRAFVALHIMIELRVQVSVQACSANAHYALNWFCVYASLVLSMPHQ